MLDRNSLVFHRADIFDYPDIPQRAFLVSPVSAASNSIDYEPYLADMAALKLNWAYLDFYRSRTLWEAESSAYFDGLKSIGKESRANGMLTMAQMVNPYAYFSPGSVYDSLGKEDRERWTHSGAGGMGKLKKQLASGMEAGATTLVLHTGDYLPLSPEGNYTLYSESDREKYINIQEAHLEMIQSVYAWSRGRYPGSRVEFMAPWYSNNELGNSRGQAEQYLSDLSSKLPRDLRILWTGPARQSQNFGTVDYMRYHDLIGRELILVDNTMQSMDMILDDTSGLKDYPMKLRMLNLFNPFTVSFSEPFMLPEKTGKLLVNQSLSSAISKLRIATAADFMWNTADYDPDMSVYKVLLSKFGREVTGELYVFSDAYYTALASVISLKQGGDHQRLIRQANEQFSIMEDLLVILDDNLVEDPDLLNELKSLKQRLEEIYDAELKTVANQIIATLKSM
jgi:hypothetical protein